MCKRFKDYLIIFIIVSILFFVYIISRGVYAPFIGADSYYFLNHIFHNTPLSLTGTIGTFIINLLPHSILGIKLIMYLITLITLFITYETARLYSKDNALIYPFSIISMITLSLVFFKFEDDLFALPFLFTSLYFITRYQLSKIKNKFFDINIILSLVFLFISVLIWNYTVLFILMYLFITNYHKLYILASVTFLIYFNKFIFMILPNLSISENQPAFIGNIAGGIILLLFFLYLKKSMIQKNKIGIYVFSILTLINFKIIYILLPILLLNNLKVLKMSYIDNKYTLYFIYFIFLIGTLNQIITLPPTQQDYTLLDVGQTYSKQLNKEIIYPWGLGYFVIYNNIDTNYFGTPPKEKIDYKNKLIITRKNNPQFKDCKLIKKSKFYELLNCP